MQSSFSMLILFLYFNLSYLSLKIWRYSPAKINFYSFFDKELRKTDSLWVYDKLWHSDNPANPNKISPRAKKLPWRVLIISSVQDYIKNGIT